MADQFVGRLIAFKGEAEYVPATEVLVEVTEVDGDNVEIAFDTPVPGKPRIYLSVSLGDVIRRAMPKDK